MTNTRQKINIVKELLDNGFDKDERREIFDNMQNSNEDFAVSDHRFIHRDEIDRVMTAELSSDTYMLGSFNAWFIAGITGLDINIIAKAQKNESYERLGELMLKNIGDVVEKYISAEGYGHHFAPYDGYEHEIGDYYMFRVN